MRRQAYINEASIDHYIYGLIDLYIIYVLTHVSYFRHPHRLANLVEVEGNEAMPKG